MLNRLHRRLHRENSKGYSAQKEVGMHNAIHSVFGGKRWLLVLGLAAMLLLIPLITTTAQPIEFKELVFGTLIELPDEYLALLVDLVGVLNESQDSVALFMEAPRAFLRDEGINLPPDAFQITGVDFLLPPATEDEPWFGVAEPLEGYLFEPKGLGVFYDNVAIFIQEAFEPLETGQDVLPANHQIDMFRFVADRFPGETLELLRAVMRQLEAMDPEDQRRVEFLVNPREYLISQDLTLPAYAYRIVAIDLNRAEAAGSVMSDELRAGLGTVREGIGVFYDSFGVFLQRAT